MVELGARIAEARGRAGMTQVELSAAADLDRVVLAKIETGRRRVEAMELSRIADALDQRYEWFFDDAPPAIVSHRNLLEPGAPDRSIDRSIERVARHVEFVQKWGALELPEPPVVDAPASNADVDVAAATARRMLGLDANEPVLNLQQRVAGVGLMAFSIDSGPDGADAASVLLKRGGVAIVNGDRLVGRRRLGLVHEFGHYIFADEYSVDFDVARHGDDEQWESRIDRFARAVLLPRRGLQENWQGLRTAGADVRTAAIRVASVYRVDMSTLARRLDETELVSSSEAGQVRRARTTKADIVELNLVVPHELEPPSLPREYEQAVLKLYREDDISSDRALDLLLDTWTIDQLPPPELRPATELWKFL